MIYILVCIREKKGKKVEVAGCESDGCAAARQLFVPFARFIADYE
jgi:hypothetical protein